MQITRATQRCGVFFSGALGLSCFVAGNQRCEPFDAVVEVMPNTNLCCVFTRPAAGAATEEVVAENIAVNDPRNEPSTK
jgi:hypothetical protein